MVDKNLASSYVGEFQNDKMGHRGTSEYRISVTSVQCMNNT